MYLGLNGATTMKADLLTDLAVAERAGYPALEIWAAKLRAYLAGGPNRLGELRRRFAVSPVKPFSINSVEFITFKRGADWELIKDQVRELAEIAAELGCPNLVVVPSPRPEGATDDEVQRESVAALSELSTLAEPFVVRLAFEFLGFGWCSVSRLGQCCAIVREVGRDNVGLVLDTFHFHAGGSELSELAELDPGRLFIFHINDCEPLPRAELQDAHRLLPGEGVIRLREIIAGLKARGYHGIASVELFRPAYWELDPFALGESAREKTEPFLLVR
jgi:2-keto-myo-inositol isomerase